MARKAAFAAVPAVMTDVACQSELCVAVGGWYDLNAQDPGLVRRSSDGGAHWTGATLPAGAGQLDSVSCPTATRCFAVGAPDSSYPSQSASPVLISNDAGAAWSFETLPAGARGSTLSTVQCSSARHCIATGAKSTSGAPLVLSTVDGGTTWSELSLPKGRRVRPDASRRRLLRLGRRLSRGGRIARPKRPLRGADRRRRRHMVTGDPPVRRVPDHHDRVPNEVDLPRRRNSDERRTPPEQRWW